MSAADSALNNRRTDKGTNRVRGLAVESDNLGSILGNSNVGSREMSSTSILQRAQISRCTHFKKKKIKLVLSIRQDTELTVVRKCGF